MIHLLIPCLSLDLQIITLTNTVILYVKVNKIKVYFNIIIMIDYNLLISCSFKCYVPN